MSGCPACRSTCSCSARSASAVAEVCHTSAQLMKMDPATVGKRKLSKRKDPELALTFYKRWRAIPVSRRVTNMS